MEQKSGRVSTVRERGTLACDEWVMTEYAGERIDRGPVTAVPIANGHAWSRERDVSSASVGFTLEVV